MWRSVRDCLRAGRHRSPRRHHSGRADLGGPHEGRSSCLHGRAPKVTATTLIELQWGFPPLFPSRAAYTEPFATLRRGQPVRPGGNLNAARASVRRWRTRPISSHVRPPAPARTATLVKRSARRKVLQARPSRTCGFWSLLTQRPLPMLQPHDLRIRSTPQGGGVASDRRSPPATPLTPPTGHSATLLQFSDFGHRRFTNPRRRGSRRDGHSVGEPHLPYSSAARRWPRLYRRWMIEPLRFG